MSEVKRYINCVIGMTGVEMVRATDYAKLDAEAQALRGEVARAEQHRNDQADLIVSLRTEVAALRMARDDFKLERDLARKNFCDEQAANYQLKAHLNTCLDELAELRARVVVLPDAANDRRKSAHYCRGWNACLDELARLNGLTVSEGLLRRIVTPALTSSDAHDRIGALEELRALLSEDKENGDHAA
ncbi:hypothetical protein [Pseudomonas aeruginosa]|uniref:hypothetical protein n=1 Tax=Pseudomonas aeruginosa TaxID=287 RepID=UPI0010529F3F|nr:hypothetical protein [Pseudomonas aeruginosa]